MSLSPIFDTDFLSALLKIGQVGLVRDLYRCPHLIIPNAVFREIGVTDLLAKLMALEGIEIQEPSPASLTQLREAAASLDQLGAGEQEAIALALENRGAPLLTNDNQARRQAAALGVEVVNIPVFLLAVKLSGLLDTAAMTDVVLALEREDGYGFRDDVRTALLA